MSNNVQQEFQVTAFGELAVAEPTPVIQIKAQNGLNDKTNGSINNGGTFDAVDSEFVVTSGTNSDGFGSLLSTRSFSYRAGQGGLCRLTARFTAGVADSFQLAGFISSTDALTFGFSGADFGVIRLHDGENPVQTLQVTTGAAGAEDATITVNGTPFTVPLTNSSIEENAVEIAKSLTAQITNQRFTANGDTVTSLRFLATPTPIYSFSSATAVAAWTVVNAGAATQTDFIPQASWNIDTLPELDPTKGNVYQIRFQYLGYGAIEFSIEDQDTGLFKLVHRIKYANTETKPSISNPIMPIGYLAANLGNTTDLTVHGASMSAFNEGRVNVTEPGRSKSVNKLAVPSGTLTPLITIRNRIVKGGAQNRGDVIPIFVSVSTDANKGAILSVIRNGDLSNDQVFDYVNEPSSITEFDTSATTITGGDVIASDVAPSGTAASQDLTTRNNFIFIEDTLTLAVLIPSGAAGDFIATISWQEDT